MNYQVLLIQSSKYRYTIPNRERPEGIVSLIPCCEDSYRMRFILHVRTDPSGDLVTRDLQYSLEIVNLIPPGISFPVSHETGRWNGTGKKACLAIAAVRDTFQYNTTVLLALLYLLGSPLEPILDS